MGNGDAQCDPPDRLTAPASSVPRRDPKVLTVADCARDFAGRRTPPLLVAATLGAVALRVALAGFDWRDLVVLAGVIGFTPLIEWAIHVLLLHAKPIRWRGIHHELLAAREHRAHHEAPAELDGVLIPAYALLVFFGVIALTVWALSFPIHAVLGGNRLAHAATGLGASYLILAGYEWAHFLIHTPYRPRGRYLRAIWRGHRLHHYKNEGYWFGVTSPFADRVLRTAPDQAAVPRSATARTLEGGR